MSEDPEPGGGAARKAAGAARLINKALQYKASGGTAAVKDVARSKALKWVCIGVVVMLLLLLIMLFGAVSGGFGDSGDAAIGEAQCSEHAAKALKALKIAPMPEDRTYLFDLYRAAAAKYQLGEYGFWVLAAMNGIESDWGRNATVSSAGATGWMQFMPATWKSYGVDADGDGTADPGNATDAIHSAARYLSASGAPEHWYKAIFAYNHADWYVAKVQNGAEALAANCSLTTTPATSGSTYTSVDGASKEELLRRILVIATEIDHANERTKGDAYPYCWGGGHSAKPGPTTPNGNCTRGEPSLAPNNPGPGLDCSGAVRWLLSRAGYKVPILNSTGFKSWGEPDFSSDFANNTVFRSGVTIWTNDSHVFIEIKIDGLSKWWGTSSSRRRGGVGFHSNRDKSAFTPRRVPGL